MAEIAARDIRAGMVFYAEDGFTLYRQTATGDARRDLDAPAGFESWVTVPTMDDDGNRGPWEADGDTMVEIEVDTTY